MDELIDVLKSLSNDMTKGDIALFDLCEKMIEQITAQNAQIKALLDNQKMINEVITIMHKSMEVQRDTIRTHTQTMKTMREILNAYTDRQAH
jgi:formyltetrahydrofolate synthetase